MTAVIGNAGGSMNEEMERYDEGTDPREARLDPKPLVTGEAPWLLQISLKTPSGSMINIRGMHQWDIAVGLEAINSLAQSIQEAEKMFFPAPAPVAQLRPQPVQAPAQQQGPPPQYGPPQQQAPQQQGQVLLCNCGYQAKYVPGGISKKTGRPYRAFYACGNPVREAQCQFRQDG